MRTSSTRQVLLWMGLRLLAGCGGGGGRVDASTDAPTQADIRDASPPDDQSTPPGDGGGSGTVTGAPADIREALRCGTPMPVTGAGAAGELQLAQMDTRTFPDALCNDGTPAVIYYRPHRGEANRNRWVISLRGGGACGSGPSCAARWCSCATTGRCPFAADTTNFDLNNMSGGGRRGANVGGVMDRAAPHPNPLADYNHAQLIYCSSDSWRGAARGVTFTTTHPITGAPVTYTAHFLGARILEAGLRTLRQDGVAPLSYTLDGAPVAMPDLDTATEVVMVGDSAGGAGIIHNLDHIAETLRASRGGCMGPSCPPSVVGIVDAVVGPDMSRLDFSMSAGAPTVTTYAQFAALDLRSTILSGSRRDASCLQWHQANRPGTEGECGDLNHVVRHHVTTPFFVRMALLDRLISGNYASSGLRDPMLGPFTPNASGVPVTFATVLQRELAAFPQMPQSAEEGMAIRTAPGVFAPACPDHDTIHTSAEVYGVTITPPGGRPLRFFDVFGAWRGGTSPASVLSSDPMRADTVCPPPPLSAASRGRDRPGLPRAVATRGRRSTA